MTVNIVLCGLGPHSKRIYINVLKKNNTLPKLIIDLESRRSEIQDYLEQEKIKAELLLVPDEYKDNEVLDRSTAKRLIDYIKTLHITHAIISTEPKAHFAYLSFFIQNDINVLSDKPITVVKDMHEVASIMKIKKQYEELVKLYEGKRIRCKIMCQRRYHRGYNYIKQVLKDVILKYNIPISYINIYHCDGKWMMPHDYDIDNHPYKYGYGKLFHSGYHFIDLLAEIIKLNKYVSSEKHITNVSIDSCKFDLIDDLTCISQSDYLNLFSDQIIPDFYKKTIRKEQYKNYGEKDLYSLMQFKNKNGRTITTANISMLQNGFSRRAWIQTKENTYKGNGRIRHESLVIQVGPLLNIQVHSYQSKEIKDRAENEAELLCGGLEHFDIYIFRNSDLIGGVPFEKIQIDQLYEKIDFKDFHGYNELAREEFVLDFLSNESQESSLMDHRLAIELLYDICLSAKLGRRFDRIDIEGMM